MTRPAPVSPSKPVPSKRSWLSRSLAKLLGRRVTKERKPEAGGEPGRPVAPTKAETSLLPLFDGLPLGNVIVPRTVKENRAAAAEIFKAGLAGFDTEARPTFRAGEKSGGPHVVQFALTNKAFVFQLHREESLRVVADLIASDRVLKVGFGLRNDHGQIRSRLGVQLRRVLDLDHVFRKRGYKGQIGVRGAMGAVRKLNFPKSKSTTTSNWAAAELTDRQLLYAANDAFAALKILEALDLDPAEISGHEEKEDRHPVLKGRRPPRRRGPVAKTS